MSRTTKEAETSSPHEAVFVAEKESSETELQDLHGEVQEGVYDKTLAKTHIKPLIDGPPSSVDSGRNRSTTGGSLTGLANDEILAQDGSPPISSSNRKIVNDGDEAGVSTGSPALKPIDLASMQGADLCNFHFPFGVGRHQNIHVNNPPGTRFEPAFGWRRNKEETIPEGLNPEPKT